MRSRPENPSQGSRWPWRSIIKNGDSSLRGRINVFTQRDRRRVRYSWCNLKVKGVVRPTIGITAQRISDVGLQVGKLEPLYRIRAVHTNVEKLTVVWNCQYVWFTARLATADHCGRGVTNTHLVRIRADRARDGNVEDLIGRIQNHVVRGLIDDGWLIQDLELSRGASASRSGIDYRY